MAKLWGPILTLICAAVTCVGYEIGGSHSFHFWELCVWCGMTVWYCYLWTEARHAGRGESDE